MVEKKRSLDSEDLARLRKLVSRKNNGSPPLEELAAIADLPEETGVTIDFEAEAELGHPLVVLRPNDNVSSTLAGLSTRELEVAALVAEGLANKEIAARLHIALGTVKDHVHNMLEKTGLANRTALATAFRASAKVLARDDDVNPSLDRKYYVITNNRWAGGDICCLRSNFYILRPIFFKLFTNVSRRLA